MEKASRVGDRAFRAAFSLVEMLVVIGIIAVLIAASLGSYTAITRAAERARARELVQQVAQALTSMYEKNDGQWPVRMAMVGETGGKLDDQVSYQFVSGDTKYLTLSASGGKLIGNDRFGVLDPWGTDTVRKKGTGATLSDVENHLLWFAVDTDGDGIIKNARVGGESVTVRASAIVWCAGKDGTMEAYKKGLKKDDVYSWTVGQTRE